MRTILSGIFFIFMWLLFLIIKLIVGLIIFSFFLTGLSIFGFITIALLILARIVKIFKNE